MPREHRMCQNAEQPVISFTESSENTFTSPAKCSTRNCLHLYGNVAKLKGACAVTWRDRIWRHRFYGQLVMQCLKLTVYLQRRLLVVGFYFLCID